MPASSFNKAQLDILRAWLDEFKTSTGEARRNIITQVNSEFGKLQKNRTAAEKSSHAKVSTETLL